MTRVAGLQTDFITEETMDRPNILVFFTDQQRWDTCGCYGQRLPVTPHLDRLAREGVLFRHAFTCQPVCGPARACIQTGLYASEIGVHTNDMALPLDADTVAKRLSAAGYETGYVGKWHLASHFSGPWVRPPPGTIRVNFRTAPVPPERRGGYRDFWVASDVLEFTSHGYGGYMYDAQGRKVEWGEDRYRADAVTDFALEFLRSRRRDRPWFLFVSYIEPHHQNDRNRYEGPHGSREQFAHFEAPGDLVGTQGDWREQYPDYLGCCHRLDFNLGRLLDQLEGSGLARNTLLVYTSDHGCHFRTRNAEYKRSCHDASIRIPLVIWGPGFARGGAIVEDLVSLVDVPATVLAAAGVDPLPHMQGRPLQHLVAGRPVRWRQEVFVQISESQVGRAIRTRRWKYAVRAPGLDGRGPEFSSPVYEEEFLYDLEADPCERNNLVRDPMLVEVRAGLRKRLLQQLVAAGEPSATVLPAGHR